MATQNHIVNFLEKWHDSLQARNNGDEELEDLLLEELDDLWFQMSPKDREHLDNVGRNLAQDIWSLKDLKQHCLDLKRNNAPENDESINSLFANTQEQPAYAGS